MGKVMASYGSFGAPGASEPIMSQWFSGPHHMGDLGPATRLSMDHNVLGTRSWEMWVKSETCHTILSQEQKWVLGKGLVLQAAPKVDVLLARGIKINADDWSEKWTKRVEDEWDIVANKSTLMDYRNRDNLHKIAKRNKQNKSIWGDVLVVHRVTKDNIVTTQLIDGQWVQTPMGHVQVNNNPMLIDNRIGYDWINPDNGNRIRYGVEIADSGEPVAYWVRNGVGLTFARLKAVNNSGMLMVYLCTAEEYRLENTRALPTITFNMNSASQVDQYTDAVLGSVVETAKLAYFFTHEKGTEAINPRGSTITKLTDRGLNNNNPDMPTDLANRQLANDFTATTKKMSFNLPAGTGVEVPGERIDNNYSEFHNVRFDADCATVGIPPEVASQKYGGSYSASRAATNGWQYMLNIERDEFGNQFYQRVYNLQLLVWVLAGIIDAPGYLEAFYSGDRVVLAAYNCANWQGDPVPQIDELKEIMAKRLLLGEDAANIPLATFEKVCQDMGEGDFREILKQYIAERKKAMDGGIALILPKGATDEPKPGTEVKPPQK